MRPGLVLLVTLLATAGCGSKQPSAGTGIRFTNGGEVDPGAPAISPAPAGRYSSTCGESGDSWTFSPTEVTTPDGRSCAVGQVGNPGPNKITLSLTCTGGMMAATREVWAMDTTSGLRIERDAGTGTKTTVVLGKCE